MEDNMNESFTSEENDFLGFKSSEIPSTTNRLESADPFIDSSLDMDINFDRMAKEKYYSDTFFTDIMLNKFFQIEKDFEDYFKIKNYAIENRFEGFFPDINITARNLCPKKATIMVQKCDINIDQFDCNIFSSTVQKEWKLNSVKLEDLSYEPQEESCHMQPSNKMRKIGLHKCIQIMNKEKQSDKVVQSRKNKSTRIQQSQSTSFIQKINEVSPNKNVLHNSKDRFSFSQSFFNSSDSPLSVNDKYGKSQYSSIEKRKPLIQLNNVETTSNFQFDGTYNTIENGTIISNLGYKDNSNNDCLKSSTSYNCGNLRNDYCNVNNESLISCFNSNVRIIKKSAGSYESKEKLLPKLNNSGVTITKLDKH